MSFARFLAVRNCRRNPSRTAALGLVAALLALALFGGSLVVLSLQNGLNRFQERLGADILVLPKAAQADGGLEGVLVQGKPLQFYMEASRLAEIASLPGVERTAPQFFLTSANAGCCSVAVQLIGFDPGVMSFLQFKFIDAFARSGIEYELLGVEHLPHYGVKFDALFCLGVLYHRSDPVRTLKELKGALNAGGELFLDTMYLDMDGDFALSPKNTYSKIPNIYFVPTISALLNWCERANFKDAQILATKPTDAYEQRKTEWILGQSLGDFLDPADPARTVEGYPAPKRAYLKLSV